VVSGDEMTTSLSPSTLQIIYQIYVCTCKHCSLCNFVEKLVKIYQVCITYDIIQIIIMCISITVKLYQSCTNIQYKYFNKYTDK